VIIRCSPNKQPKPKSPASATTPSTTCRRTEPRRTGTPDTACTASLCSCHGASGSRPPRRRAPSTTCSTASSAPAPLFAPSPTRAAASLAPRCASVRRAGPGDGPTRHTAPSRRRVRGRDLLLGTRHPGRVLGPVEGVLAVLGDGRGQLFGRRPGISPLAERVGVEVVQRVEQELASGPASASRRRTSSAVLAWSNAQFLHTTMARVATRERRLYVHPDALEEQGAVHAAVAGRQATPLVIMSINGRLVHVSRTWLRAVFPELGCERQRLVLVYPGPPFTSPARRCRAKRRT